MIRLPQVTGYCRTGRKARKHADYVALVFDALSRAVRHDLPLVPAVRGLLDEPELHSGVFTSYRRDIWHLRVRALVKDLEQGQPLVAALDRHLGRFMPAHFRDALASAERRNRLKEVIPILADSLGRGRLSATQWRAALAYVIVQFTVMFSIVSGLMIFIVPKFSKIFDEMLPGEPLPALTLFVIECSQWLERNLGSIVVVVILLYAGRVLLTMCPWPWLQARVEAVLSAVPIIGPIRRRLAYLELAQTMAVCLAADGDLLAAAECAAKSSRSPMIRARVNEFLDQVRSGRPWAEAWTEMGLGTPLYDLIVRNAAAREQPLEGFHLLMQWQADEVVRHAARVAVLFEPCAILCNAVCVGAIVMGMFLPLWTLVCKLGD